MAYDEIADLILELTILFIQFIVLYALFPVRMHGT